MDASSSASSKAMPGHFPSMSASPSETPGASTPSTDGVNQEPHMRWPPPTFLAGQGFHLPFQQRASSDPLLAFSRLQERYKQHFEMRYGANPFSPGVVVSSPFPPSSSATQLPDVSRHSSFSARVDQERRISASLHMLRDVQQTLQQRHREAQMQLARTEKLVEQTAWDLFFQSPLDFVCHEMDIPAGAAAAGGRSIIPNAQSVHESEAWMKELDDLRDLQDEECAVKKRMEKTERQMKRADEMMLVGSLKQQELSSLQRGSSFPFYGQYHGLALPHHFPAVQTMAFPSGVNTAGYSKDEGPAMPSMFSNWPQPAAPHDAVRDEGGSSANAADSGSSTGSSSHFEASCGPDCCGHRAQ